MRELLSHCVGKNESVLVRELWTQEGRLPSSSAAAAARAVWRLDQADRLQLQRGEEKQLTLVF